MSRLCPALPPDHPGADPASQAVHKRSAGKDEAAERRKAGEKSREILENVKTTFLTIWLTRRSGTVSNDVGSTRGCGVCHISKKIAFVENVQNLCEFELDYQ